MLAITQFEVQVLQKGRWLIHARYPGEEHHQAVQDARATEASTGFPSKVIRETYFPDINESERITIYISQKAKDATKTAASQRRPAIVARAATALTSGKNVPRTTRPRLTAAQTFFRVIVAGGISLGAATLVTGVVAWALHRLAEVGLDMASDVRTMVLTYSYVSMFLFFFWSLFRSRLPLHRLLADLWAKTSKATETVKADVNAKPPKVKPKYDRTASPEALREVEDLKVKRGDVDAGKPPELSEEPAPVTAAAPSPAVESAVEAARAAEVARVGAEETAAEKAAIEKKRKQAEKLAQKEAAQKEAEKTAAQQAVQPTAPTPEPLRESLNLERMVLRRFAIDVVKPAVRSAMPDDPVTRRGTAVVLAGGAAGVAGTAQINASAELELLVDAMHHIGMKQGAIDSFLGQRDEQMSAAANTGLLAAGRSALAAYLEGGADVAAVLARALSNWRTPMGQNILPMPGVSVGEITAVPLLDVYILTELREDDYRGQNETAAEAFHDQSMGTHNNVVRAAITAHGGHEVKHTGKGIFARFPAARAAVDAAVDMQHNFTESTSKLAIGIIGNTVAGEDPILSANLVRQAQSILSRTGPGEILCEAQVQAAVRRHQSADEIKAGAGQSTEDLGLTRLVVPEANFEGPQQAKSPLKNTAAS